MPIPIQAKNSKGIYTKIAIYEKRSEYCLDSHTELYLTQLTLFAHRSTLLRSLNSSSEHVCTFDFQINPFYPLEKLISSSYHYTNDPCCDDQTVYHYVIWVYVDMDHNMAESLL